jgi:general secretion pathway protein A
VQHRLRVAGAARPIFMAPACRELYRLSAGIPRIINVLADRALLGAFTSEATEITPKLVRRAAAEVYGDDPDMARPWQVGLRLVAMAGVAALLIGAAVFTSLLLVENRDPATASAPTSSTSAPLIEPAAGPATTVQDLEALLLSNADSTDTRSAFATLFNSWGFGLGGTTTPACDQAKQYQLSCFYRRGSFTQVQQLDRPTILTLKDIAGTTHQVVLTALNENTATLQIGDANYAVSVGELSKLWYGEYLLLWRPQISTVKAFVLGMQDPDVAWLRQSLAMIQGRAIDPMNSTMFDAELEARVRDYQIDRRLAVDGKVGQQTQILMNSDLDIGAPRLVRPN